MPKISREFLARLKLAEKPGYKLAQQAGISPVVLSKLTCGIITPRPNDVGILAVGALLKLSPAECFEPDPSAKGAAHGGTQ